MAWHEEWRAISARIEGFVDASRIFFSSVPVQGSDFHGVSNASLIPNAKALKTRINQFLTSYSNVLPSLSIDVSKPFMRNFNPESYSGIPGVQAAAIFLAEFRSEFELSISGSAEYAKGLVERAFIHLNRTIIVDENFRNKWIEGFEKGETAVENLGAIHLLSHGIWAFKANSIGERTDLIFGGHVNISEVQITNSTLVLTEWKKINSNKEIDVKSRQAVKQSERYSMGSLAGIELSYTRYIVLVSEKYFDTPKDYMKNRINYRHINIAVNPDPPSVK